jgi:hypothetical protein
MQRLVASGAVRHIYVVRRQRVNEHICSECETWLKNFSDNVQIEVTDRRFKHKIMICHQSLLLSCKRACFAKV